jgi:hypothetical protein
VEAQQAATAGDGARRVRAFAAAPTAPSRSYGLQNPFDPAWVVVIRDLSPMFLAIDWTSDEAAFWFGGPAALSLTVLTTGILLRGRTDRRAREAGTALIVIGIGGLILSAAWVAFASYVDAVLGNH